MAIPEESPKAVGWFEQALKWQEEKQKSFPYRRKRTSKFKRGWRVPPCIRKLEKATLPDGRRHTCYLALAKFYAWIEMHPEGVEQRLREIDTRHPIKDQEYLQRVAGYGREHPGFPGCNSLALEAYCDENKYFRARSNYRGKRVPENLWEINKQTKP